MDDEIVKITCWEDIFSRERYQDGLDPKQFKPIKMIAPYSDLRPLKPCGLVGCRQGHGEGCLIRAENGTETNIGGTCGRKYFPEEMGRLRNAYKRKVNINQYRSLITEYKENLPDIRNRIRELTERDPSPTKIVEGMKRTLTQLLDDATSKAIIERSRQKKPTVYRQVALDPEELEAARATGSRATHREEQVFSIAGLSAVKHYHKINQYMRKDLGTELSDFSDFDVSAAGHDELKVQYNWTKKINKRIKEVEELMDECIRFLSRPNWDNISRAKELVKQY